MLPGESGTETGTPNSPALTEEDAFHLQVTKDKMAILLDCNTAGRNLPSLAEEIIARLLTFGVTTPPSAEWLAGWLKERTSENLTITKEVVVSGMPPIPPVDGHIEWGGDFFNKGYVLDEGADRVDFRSHAGQRNVKSDQLLAAVKEPRAGEHGYDVFGEEVRARKPRRRRIRAGHNVRQDVTTDTYYSEIAGRIRFVNEILSVDDHYEIKGDVGLKTGHISHAGSLRVQGDVLEGSRIEAMGDIEIMGVVEAAHIQTGGTLTVHGGITGVDGAHIIAAGGVAARYILDATVQAGDDIVVEREIVQSTVHTRGAVYVRSGRIVGGHVTALGGVDAREIGSAAQVVTEVTAGEDFCLEGQLFMVHSKVIRLKQNIARIHASIEPLRGKIAQLPPEKKQVIRTLLEQLAMMEATLAELTEEEEELREESRSRENHTILIRHKVFPEARLRVRGEVIRVQEIYTGRLRPVPTKEGIRIAMTNVRTLNRARSEAEAPPAD